MTEGLLAGMRVLDLSAITAGGRTTHILGDFGADVIKIEGPTRPDPFRHWTGVTGTSGSGDLENASFVVVGRSKRGLAVDLKKPEGVEIFRRLVEGADLVVENFRRGVMESLGIGFDQLVAWNPTVSLLSISSQGDGGPERNYISFGGTLEALGGLMSVTGYSATEPVWTTSKVNFPDQVVAVLGPGLAIAAVLRARSQGRGIHVDLAQRDTVIALLGTEIVAASLSGIVPIPCGNASDDALTLCLPTAGEDQWCVLSVTTDAQWQVLLATLGLEGGSTPWQAIDRDQAAALLGPTTRTFTKAELMARLQQVGIPAAEVLHASEIASRADQRDEAFDIDVPSPRGGTERHLSWPFEIPPTPPLAVTRRAPHIGEHSREILAEIGYSETAIDSLASAGIIAGLPAATGERP